MEICLCTSNANKSKEFQHYLDEYLQELKAAVHVSIQNVDAPEIQGTPEEIVIHKCRRAFEIVGRSVVVEDTALEFNAFKGLPGPYIKCFLNRLGPSGLYDILKAQEDKTACAVTRLAFSDGTTSTPRIFEGRGTIVPPRGSSHFGWDCIFLPHGQTNTYGEMTTEEKNLISHRGKAIAQFGNFLKLMLLKRDKENTTLH